MLCSEDLLQGLAEPIAIVGNGHPVIAFGRAVDRYPTVIRLNNFRLSGFEEQVGSKTSVRSTSGWLNIEARPGLIELSPFCETAEESSALSAYRQRTPVPVVTASLDIHDLLPGVPKPSTGLALAALLSKLGKRVHLFGFDGFRSGHYWEPAAPMPTVHSPSETDALLSLPGVVFYGHTYNYARLYDYCHAEHRDYNHNEGLSVFRNNDLAPRGERIVEFGAGNGGLSAYLESLGNRVTAVEVSQVAYARIPIADKINGDCLSLSVLEPDYDRFVCMDVLEHLTENDIEIVIHEAARLAPAVLLSISTRPSGLTGPAGENLHLTVRSVEWWIDRLEPHFELKLRVGHETGQVLIEGQRRTAPLPCRALQPTDDRFELPPDYEARAVAEYFVDVDTGVTWQPDVYPHAADLARSLGCDTVIDIGCGHARKLSLLHPEFKLIGVDFGANIQHCRCSFAFGTWLESDFERAELLPIPDTVLHRSVVICSDVIEHLSDPRALLALLRRLLESAAAVLISTPDRERLAGLAHRGPPTNVSHTREWSLAELNRWLLREGFAIATSVHTRSNDAESTLATCLVVAINPGHSAIAAQNVAYRQAAAEPAADEAERNAAARFERAQAAFEAGDIEAFESELGEALTLCPWHRDSVLYLARLQLERDQASEASELLEALLKNHPDDQDVLESAVTARLRLGDRQGAANLLQA